MKKKLWMLIMAGLLTLSLALVGCGNKDGEEASKQNTDGTKTSEVTEVAPEDTPVTYDNFMAIEMGSDKAEAEKLFGKGEKLEGIEGSDIYTWQGQGIGNMVLIFQDDKVVEKSQTDLAERSAEINAEQAAFVTEGMTLADAEAQLGPANLVSENLEDDGSSTKTYEWKNPNGSVLSITVQNDTIVSALAVGLE